MKKYFLGLFIYFVLINNINSQVIPKSVPFLKKNGFYTLVKSGSKIPVVEKTFDNLRVLSSSLIIFQEENKWGILDMNGKVKLNNNYSEINLINKNLIELIGGDRPRQYVDTLMSVVNDSLTNDLYIKKEPKIYSLPKEYFKYLIDTSGYSFASYDKDQFIIDQSSGRKVKGNLSILYVDNKTKNLFFDCEVIIEFNEDQRDSNGEIVTDRFGRTVKKKEILSSGILLFTDNGKYISQYTDVKSLGLDLYSVSKNFKKADDLVFDGSFQSDNFTYGIIDGSGNKITPLKYTSIDPFSSGLSLVNNSGFVNSKGDMVIPMTQNRKFGYYDGVTQEDPNTIEVKFMDSTGKTTFHLKNLSLRYTSYNENWDDVTYGLKNFDKGLLFVNGVDPSNPPYLNKPKVLTGFEGICLIDNRGNIIKCGNWGEWKGDVEFPTLFYDEYSLTLNPETKKYGIINKKGRYVLNPKYDFVFRYCGEIVEFDDLDIEYDLGQKRILKLKYLSYIFNPSYEHHSKKLILNNLILVKQSDNIFYVDTDGFEYIEK